jgi:hypothetical protein
MLKQSSHINILDDCLGYFQLKKDIVDIYDDLSEKLKYRDGAMEELRFKKINLEDLENAKNDLDSYEIYEGEEKDLFDKRVEYLKSERTINFFEALDQKISNESFSSGMLALSRFDGSDLPSEIKSNIQVISDLLDNAHSTIDEAKNTLPKLASENKSYLKEFGLNEELIKKSTMEFLKKQDGVAFVVDIPNAQNATIPEYFKEKIINGYHPDRSGVIQIVLDPAWYSGSSPRSTGATHGTMNPADVHIPMVFMGWGIKQGTSNNSYNMTDIAPTISGILHIQEPNGNIGKAVTEAIK